ncbi:MAG: type II toxin-antitoxin system RelE/ParE family toxin [Gemmatimonadota bacterium]|nr:type II toxin-antitoxin system RelE/ParE family toxin [Gemmatimonadota bacterium]MDQ8177615.1 type II toxin-antitoxin system RelE/ParE family toxin [Gemmatimonadota bacterium]
MIRSFADKRTEALFENGSARGIPPDLVRRAAKKLDAIDSASQLSELLKPAGNRLHALRGDREGQYAIAVNDQWRICFQFVDGDAYDVEICDYH